ncbi:hypothetical protein ACEZCY_35665 [Streptacidiphilus sp. N1-12]|uniref:Uncharacterized protein n=1 Tax=Streptacidiphilus alkalitolerans TaxID=3342712 RepID=A0ABV6WR42_9ACTN
MTKAWQEYAVDLRALLGQAGVATPNCLPGEPDDCGADFAHHCMGYLAALKAKADHALTHMHHGDPAGERAATKLYDHWSAQFAAESVDCC